MIYSDRHRFVFVHIPKCAGTSVRRALAAHDDSGGRFGGRIVEHPRHGRVDWTHLPLALMAELAPEVFARLADPAYLGIALLRDPFERFPSALAQRIKMYRGVEMAQIGRAALEAEIEAVIARLEAEPAVTEAGFIHFARQVDFVEHEGRRLLDALVPVERLDLLAALLGARIGAPLPPIGQENPTRMARWPALRPALRLGGRAARALLPGNAGERMRRRARTLLLRPASAGLSPVFDSARVRDFVARHYAADLALHRQALADAGGGGPAGGRPAG
ncbi:MAG TPA: sulfotransferase family 2 domain-containing protein [Thermohalobaculum sp.]|nr:sulfotransferase family 2 domain-containing protein [Thermohalobaculum sp.]